MSEEVEMRIVTEHELDEERRQQIKDQIWQYKKDYLKGYCPKTGSRHTCDDFTLQFWLDDMYLAKWFIRMVTGRKKCRKCGVSIWRNQFKEARELEKLEDHLMDALTIETDD